MPKFPHSDAVFPSINVSLEEQQSLKALAERQVAQTEREFDNYIQSNSSVVDMRRWKALKTRSNFAVYQERDNLSFSDEWRLPRLLVVGTLVGTLENVMYGLHAPTARHMKAQASDHLLNAQVLQEFKGPTIAHPFQFFGLKWLVGSFQPVFGGVVLPRDIIGLEHTGIKQLSDGSKLGHLVLHSVNLPQYPDLQDKFGFVRARVCICVLLRQRSTHVEVFIMGRVAAQGWMLGRLALLAAANSLTFFMSAGECAQRRKLAWRVQQKGPLPAAEATGSSTFCPLCTKPIDRAFSSPARCQLCRVRMCSRCRVVRKLVLLGPSKSNTTHPVVVELCPPCIVQTTQEDAAAIGRQEILTGEYGRLTSPRVKKEDQLCSQVDFAASAGPLVFRSPLKLHQKDNLAASFHHQRDNLTASFDSNRMKRELLSQDSLDRLQTKSKQKPDQDARSKRDQDDCVMSKSKPLTIQDLDVPNTETELEWSDNPSTVLWKRMSAMHVMAESTYRYTKETTEKSKLLLSSSLHSPTSSTTTNSAE